VTALGMQNFSDLVIEDIFNGGVDKYYCAFFNR